MSDPHDPVGVAKPTGWFWWLAGRAGRREYWTWIGLLFAIGFIFSHAPPAINFAEALAMMFVQIRRTHDLGRSGWWGVAATLAPLLPLFPLFYLAGEDVAIVVGLALELTLLITLGALPGTVGANRFGPQPPFTLRQVLIGR
jgi:uncharacterized membrane protein YhaH (DUF805 family)